MKAALLNDTSVEAHLGCQLTVRNLKALISKKYEFIGSSSVGDQDYFYRTRSFGREIHNLVSEADIVFINGEGSIHRDTERARGLLSAGCYIKYKLRKKVALVNHSALSLVWSSKYLKSFDYIAVRESTSLLPYLKLGVPAALSFDCSVLEEYEPWRKQELNGTIAIIHGQTKIDHQRIERESGFRVDLVDCCFDRDGNHKGMSFGEAFERLSNSDAIISSSFHGSVFSMIVERPLMVVPARNCKNLAVYRDIYFRDCPDEGDFFWRLRNLSFNSFYENMDFVKKSLVERAKLNVPLPSYFENDKRVLNGVRKNIYYQGYTPSGVLKNGIKSVLNL